MKKIILFTFSMFMLNGCSAHLEEDRAWTAFWNDDSTLIGYRDQKGRTRIEPRYTGFSTASKFEKIIAVMELNEGEPETYYLTRSGKIVGRNNIYLFDNHPDCESEGFIRFRDRKTDKVGMYNSEGAIVIPAEYDDLTNVRNGLVIALKGAVKNYWEKNKSSGCEHFSWVGGKEFLLTADNRIIVDDFQSDAYLNLFSLKIDDKPAKDAQRQSFRGVDGRYYTFINYKKEFQAWLFSVVLSALSKESLMGLSYPVIYFWNEPEGWTSEVSHTLIERNFERIGNRLSELKREKTDFSISMDGLNPFIFESAEFEKYFNHCGEPKEWQYPVMSVIIHHFKDGLTYQDHFDFLRTENGYRFISMTLGKERFD